jgi:opacity protein-like surface antigen
MAFYDFFNGTFFPIKKIIPYIGFGLGYADTLTELNLSDPYGDLLQNLELAQYGDTNSASGSIISFYPSQRHTSNIAGLLSVGLSYALNTNMHFDFGVRMMYLPRVKWGLTNADDTRHREFFSAKNLIYTNVMAAIRFEF